MVQRSDLLCPLCAGCSGHDERLLAGYPLVRCDSCSFVFTWPRPSREASRERYATGARGGTSAPAASGVDVGEELMREYEAEYTPYVLQSLAARLRRVAGRRPVRRMLDFGCGSGHVLGLAREVLGCQIHGVELHPVGHLGAARFGFDLQAGALEDAAFQNSSFDLIYASQVFEHLPDPRAELAILRRLLAPEGRLYIEVPNYASISIRVGRDRFVSNTPPGHLNYFTPTTLRRLVQSAGLAVAVLRTTGLNYRALLGRERSAGEAQGGDSHSRKPRLSSSALRTKMLWFVDQVLSIPGWGTQVEIVARRGPQ
jgi:SAM-dependent methyltransferase